MLSEITKFNKSALKQVNTKVTQLPCVNISKNQNYSHQNERDMTEYWDKPSIFYKNIQQLANIIKESKNLVIYTGAGISTSASIPDYRGENGIWTLTDRGEKAPSFNVEQALPTVSHMIIKGLIDAGFCKMVVSTNVDGLHIRSGITEDKISELHGNCFKEKCIKCNKIYHRTFDVTLGDIENSHKTNRYCDICGDVLVDTIIHFNEGLNQNEYLSAKKASEKADVSLVLGTSMLVSPANLLPCINPNNKLIIVNRQKTPFDGKAKIRLFGDTDDVLLVLAKELNLSYPNTIDNDSIKLTFPCNNHEDKYKSFKPKLEEKQKDKEQILTRKSGQEIIEKLSNTTHNINSSSLSPGTLVYFENCSKLESTIDTMVAKVILHQLNDCIITINKDILTSCLEIIDCNNVIINIHRNIRTISIDKSNDCSFQFLHSEMMGSIYSCDINNIIINLFYKRSNCISYNISNESIIQSNNNNIQQYITRFTNDNTFLTERVIREGVGYATTSREKTLADIKQRRLLKAFGEVILKEISNRK